VLKDREYFLKRWEEEKLSEQITRVKRWVQGNKKLDTELKSLCLTIIDYCLEEKEFWMNILGDDKKFEKLPQIKKRALKIPLIELIQWFAAHIFEANITWGTNSSLERYLGSLIETATTMMGKIPGNIDAATRYELDFYRQLLSDLEKGNLDEKLAKSWSFLERLVSLDPSFENHKKRADEEMSKAFQGYPLEEEISRFMEFRSERFGRTKPLSRMVIPSIIRRVPFTDRINRQVVDFVSNESVIFLNIWGSYVATRRYRFRLTQSEISKIVLNLNVRPDMKSLEIFGNLPVFSWITAYLGLTATVIDFHYTEKEGEVSAFRTKGLQLINSKDSNGFFLHIKDFEAIEAEGRSLEQEIRFDRVSPTGSLKLIDWLNTEINNRFHPLSLDLTNLDECKRHIAPKSYDRLFIDPPFGQETDYQNPDALLIIKNALILAKDSLKDEGVGCITFPKFSSNNPNSIRQRENIISLLKDEQVNFQDPGRKRWILFSVRKN
ncbi:MAG: hypothetical protein ACFFD4_30925, partial [Candidatus Odinarchaeota archaeon]